MNLAEAALDIFLRRKLLDFKPVKGIALQDRKRKFRNVSLINAIARVCKSRTWIFSTLRSRMQQTRFPNRKIDANDTGS